MDGRTEGGVEREGGREECPTTEVALHQTDADDVAEATWRALASNRSGHDRNTTGLPSSKSATFLCSH